MITAFGSFVHVLDDDAEAPVDQDGRKQLSLIDVISDFQAGAAHLGFDSIIDAFNCLGEERRILIMQQLSPAICSSKVISEVHLTSPLLDVSSSPILNG
jgi:hypothetical protein